MDQATQQMVIDAPAASVWDVLTDFERLPGLGRATSRRPTSSSATTRAGPLVVAFRAAAMGRSTTYTLRYDYERGARRLAWVLVAGDIMRKLDGAYELAAGRRRRRPHRGHLRARGRPRGAAPRASSSGGPRPASSTPRSPAADHLEH